jgi:hypothetical protein
MCKVRHELLAAPLTADLGSWVAPSRVGRIALVRISWSAKFARQLIAARATVSSELLTSGRRTSTHHSCQRNQPPTIVREFGNAFPWRPEQTEKAVLSESGP